MLYVTSLTGKNESLLAQKRVIGRTVQNCHPPRSVHVVEELLADFKADRKDTEDFWIKFRDKDDISLFRCKG